MNRSSIVIESQDFDRLVSEIAASIWNHLIEKPPLRGVALSSYADIFDAVAETLVPYRTTDLKNNTRRQS